MLNETVQSSPCTPLTVDIHPLVQCEPAPGVRSEDMVQMEVAQEEAEWFIPSEVIPQSIHTFASIKDYVMPIGIDKHTGGATCLRTVPPISSQKDDIHCLVYRPGLLLV